MESEERPLTVGDALARTRVAVAVAFLAALAVIGGSLGPWLSTTLGSVSGVHGHADGWVTLAAGALSALALVAAQGRRWGTAVAVPCLLAALGVSGFDGSRLVYATSKLTIFGYHIVGVGWGVYLTAAAAAIGAVALASLGGTSPYWRVTELVIIVIVGGGCITAGVLVERHQFQRALSATSNPAAAVNASAPASSSPAQTVPATNVTGSTAPNLSTNPTAATDSSTIPAANPAPTVPADGPTSNVAGTDAAGYNTGPGCSDNPSTPLPGCSDSPSVPNGDPPGTCTGGIVVDKTTTSCGLAVNVQQAYTGDGALSADSPERGQNYTFNCSTGGSGTTGDTFCIGQAGASELYVRWHQ